MILMKPASILIRGYPPPHEDLCSVILLWIRITFYTIFFFTSRSIIMSRKHFTIPNCKSTVGWAIIEASLVCRDNLHLSLDKSFRTILTGPFNVTETVSSYTSNHHIRRALKRCGQAPESPLLSAQWGIRSAFSWFDFRRHCIFCGEEFTTRQKDAQYHGIIIWILCLNGIYMLLLQKVKPKYLSLMTILRKSFNLQMINLNIHVDISNCMKNIVIFVSTEKQWLISS